MSADVKDLAKIKDVFPKILQKLGRFSVIIFTVAIFVVFSFLIIQINSFARAEPDQDKVQEEMLSGTRSLKIDDTTINALKRLENQNVEVRTLFNQARDNPFSE
jgi:hypothetical protein